MVRLGFVDEIKHPAKLLTSTTKAGTADVYYHRRSCSFQLVFKCFESSAGSPFAHNFHGVPPQGHPRDWERRLFVVQLKAAYFKFQPVSAVS